MIFFRVFLVATIGGLLTIGCASTSDGGAEQSDADTKVASIASSDGAAPPDEVVSRIGSESDDGVVCQRVKLTGSRFPRRICMTAAERQEMLEDSREFLNTRGHSGAMQSVNNALIDPSRD